MIFFILVLAYLNMSSSYSIGPFFLYSKQRYQKEISFLLHVYEMYTSFPSATMDGYEEFTSFRCIAWPFCKYSIYWGVPANSIIHRVKSAVGNLALQFMLTGLYNKTNVSFSKRVKSMPLLLFAMQFFGPMIMSDRHHLICSSK